MLRLIPLFLMALAACGAHDHSHDFNEIQRWKNKGNRIFLVEIPYNVTEKEVKQYGDGRPDAEGVYTAVYFYMEGSKVPGISARYRWDYSKVSEYIHSKGFDRYTYRYVRSPNSEISFSLADPSDFP